MNRLILQILISSILFMNFACTKKNLSDLAAAEDSQSNNGGNGSSGGGHSGGGNGGQGSANYQFDDISQLTQFIGTNSWNYPLQFNAIKFTNDGAFYVASIVENSIYKFNSSNEFVFKKKLTDSIEGITESKLAIDSQNNLWVSANSKTYKISANNGDLALTLSSNFNAIQWQSTGHIVIFKSTYSNQENQLIRFSSDGTQVNASVPYGGNDGECNVSGNESIYLGQNDAIILAGCHNARFIQLNSAGVFQANVDPNPSNIARLIKMPNGHFFYLSNGQFYVIDASGNLQWSRAAETGDGQFTVDSSNRITYYSNSYLKGPEIIKIAADGQSQVHMPINKPANIFVNDYNMGTEIVGFDHLNNFIFKMTSAVDPGLTKLGFFRIATDGNYVDRFPSQVSETDLLNPTDMVVDSSGNYYVVDQGNSQVKKFAADGQYQWSYGGVSSQKKDFFSVVISRKDDQGNTYLLAYSQGGHNFIRKYNSDGEFVTQFGGAQQNQGYFYAVASDMVVDSSNGIIYIVEQFQVVEFSLDGTYLGVFAGNGTNPNDSCGNLVGTGKIYQGKRISINQNGSKIFVLDECGGIKVFSANGTYVTELNLAYPIRTFLIDENDKIHIVSDTTIEKFAYTSTFNQESQFNFDNLDSQSFALTPSDLVIYNNKYYILAYNQNNGNSSLIRQNIVDGSLDSKVEKDYSVQRIGLSGNSYFTVRMMNSHHAKFEYYNSTNTLISTETTVGYGDQELVLPNRITIDTNGLLYISDMATGRIVAINQSGQFVKNLNLNYDNAGRCLDMAIDSTGNLFYIMRSYGNQNQIYRFSTVDGSGASFSGGYDNYEGVSRIAINSNDRVYLSAYNNSSTLKIYSFLSSATSIGSGTTVSVVGGNNATKKVFDLQIDPSDQLPIMATKAGIYKFNSSNAVIQKNLSFGVGPKEYAYATAFYKSSNGELLILDLFKSNLLKFSLENLFLKSFSNVNISSIVALPSGDYYLTDGAKVMKLNSSGQQYWDTSAAVTMQMVGDIAADASGNLYVSSIMSHVIYKFDASTGGIIDQIGTLGVSGSANGELNMPAGLEVDSSGNLVVADYGNQRVQVFSATGDYIRKYSGAVIGVGIKANGHHVYFLDSTNEFVEVDENGQTVNTVTNTNINDGFIRDFYFDDNGKMYFMDEGVLCQTNDQFVIENQVVTGGSTLTYGLSFQSGFLFSFGNQINVYDTNLIQAQ